MERRLWVGIGRRTMVFAGAAFTVASVAGLGAVIWRPQTGQPAPGKQPNSTTIKRQDLQAIKVLPGTLGYGPERFVDSRLEGTITGLTPVGAIVTRGQPLFHINDQPVVLFLGSLPSFRELTEGRAADPGDAQRPPAPAVAATEGRDVLQFKNNLRALGYAGVSTDDRFTSQTAAAVRKWQKELGLPQTGSVELGRLYYSADSVRIAGHKLTAGAVANGPIVTVTGITRSATVTGEVSDSQIAKAGVKVVVELADGKLAPGTITATSESAEPPAKLEVQVALDDPGALGDLGDSAVRVRLSLQERKNILVVPIGALVALTEGGFGVQLLAGGSSRFVAVTTGLYANGLVEISGEGISEGQTVGMAQ